MVNGITTWLAAALLAAAVAGDDGRAAAGAGGESIEVKVRGTLRAGLMAIGGETTGYAIRARGVTWELDLGTDEDLKHRADALDGQTVVVTGSFEARPGVEMKTRSIVKVETLTAAGQGPTPRPRR
jgi:hypothetical protein